jgi:hypothetical protein
MKIISGLETLKNLRSNRNSSWCGDDFDSPGINPTYAANRLRQPFLTVSIKKKFDLDPAMSVYAMGSCFAREIELAMRAAGLAVLSYRPDEFETELYESDYDYGAHSFLFRYTTASMLQELERITGQYDLPERSLLVGKEHSLLDLNFGGDCRRGPLDLILKRRAHTREIGSRIADAEIVVLTLGLIEAWYDLESDLYINAAPDLALLRRSERFQLRLLNYEDNLKNLHACYETIRQVNKGAKFIVTVSPVPLQATFTDDDVVVANTRSKSTLRSVADAFCADRLDSLYFPSYEMAINSNPTQAWRGDRRHVTRPMAAHIIDIFMSNHDLPTRAGERILWLADIAETSIRTLNVIENGFSMQSNEIFLHPSGPVGEGAACVRFENIPGRAAKAFNVGVRVARAESAPIRFTVQVCPHDGNSQPLERHIFASGGGEKTIDFKLPDFGAGLVDISLSTAMADPSSSAANAWAFFLAPQITYAG